MEYIFLILLLLNASIAFSTFFNKKVEQTLVLSIFLYILILFLCGVLGSLNLGFIMILITNGGLLVYNIYSFLRKRININKNILTVGLILFIISYIVIVWNSIDRVASSWDEFSHWATVVKNMFDLGNLGIGTDSTVMVKDYLSGTSLFQFFCVKLCGKFNESMLYVGMDVMLIAFIIPIFNIFKKKNSFISCVLYFVLFLTPTLFYPTVYSSLYVDAILGLAFAYSIYSYFDNREKKLDKFVIINLMMSLSMLVFIKDFGLVLMLITFGIILLDNMFIKNKFNLKKVVKDNYLLCLTIIPALLIKVIWVVALNVYGVVSDGSGSSILVTVKNMISLNFLDYQKEVIASFVNATVSTSLTNTFIPITYIIALFIMVIISYFIIKNSKRDKKSTMMLVTTFIILGAVVYAGLILLAYLAVFSSYEALRLASFARYMGTYALGAIFLLFAIIIKTLSDDENKLGIFSMILLGIFIINFSFATLLNMTVFARSNSKISNKVREPYKEFTYKTSKYMKKNDYLYFVSTNDNGIDYYIARYELTPNKMNKKFAWSIGIPYSEEDIWTVYKSEDEWREELLKDYEYVYLYDIDEQFVSQYKDLFINENIEDNQLYRVIETDEYSILQFVE